MDDTSLRLAQLRAEIAGTDAALSAVAINLSKAELVAPFVGVIGTRDLDAGSVATPGAPVASLTEDAPPRFHAGLAPEIAAGLAEGEQAVIRAEGRSIPARLAGVAPTLDSATRSRMAFFELEGDELPPDGSTGEVALMRRVEGVGAWVPLAALRPGPRATWTLLTVRGGMVAPEAAEIVHLEADRAYVRGTFGDDTAYLPGGTHRVVPGQAVTVSEAVAWGR